MQVISSGMHGAFDYAYAAALGFAPEVFGYKDDRDFTTFLPRLFAASVVVYSLFTRYE